MALVQNPFLLTRLKLFFAANISTAFPPLMSAALMFFSFYNIKILQLFKMKLMLSHHMVFNFIVSTE